MLTIRNHLFRALMFTSILLAYSTIAQGQQQPSGVILKVKVQNLFSTVTSIQWFV